MYIRAIEVFSRALLTILIGSLTDLVYRGGGCSYETTMTFYPLLKPHPVQHRPT
jgi:hypothetical protein